MPKIIRDGKPCAALHFVEIGGVLDRPIGEATTAVTRDLTLIEIVVMPVTPEIARIALSAFEHYGEGRHSARFNFGDCFAYA